MRLYRFVCEGFLNGVVRAGSQTEAVKIATKKVRQHLRNSEFLGKVPPITVELAEPGESGPNEK